MPVLIFYEKPGCITNAKQKRLLQQMGITLDVRNLLKHPWDQKKLAAFFDGLPVKDWFNSNAPQIKYGEINPDKLKADEAIALMLKEPLLIRRPLLQYQSKLWCGFSQKQISEYLQQEGLVMTINEQAEQVDESCSHPRAHIV